MIRPIANAARRLRRISPGDVLDSVLAGVATIITLLVIAEVIRLIDHVARSYALPAHFV